MLKYFDTTNTYKKENKRNRRRQKSISLSNINLCSNKKIYTV